MRLFVGIVLFVCAGIVILAGQVQNQERQALEDRVAQLEARLNGTMTCQVGDGTLACRIEGCEWGVK